LTCHDDGVKVDAVFRGRISTWHPGRPLATAMAVHGGRVVAFNAEAEELARDARLREDFGSASIFPGFHDAHCHTVGYGLTFSELDLSTPPISSLDELYRVVGERARELDGSAGPTGGSESPRASEWVVGCGYDQNKLGGGHPSIERLDEVAGGRPVWLTHTSGHLSMVNAAVLHLIGGAIDDPIDGGLVRRDPEGRPTGLLEERAQALVRRLVLPRSLESLAVAIGRAHDRYVAEGLTSVCDAGVAGGWIGQSPVEIAAYQLAKDRGRLRVRTTVMLSRDALVPVSGHRDDDMEGALGLPGGLRTGFGDDWLRLGPVKVFSDGSLIGRTCWMQDDFADDPGNTGYPQADPEELRSVIIGAHLAGWQVATHAIGDAAVSAVLEWYAEALSRRPRPDHRHRIEHCGVTAESSVTRLASLGVVPVPQGRFIGEIGDGMLAALGPERAEQTYRLRSFLDAGAALPGSSDRPVVDGRPLRGIEDMVRRLTASGAPFGPEEALTPEQALRAYSVGSAFAERVEHDRGSLLVGQLADFVVLGEDPRTTAVAEISSVPVVATAIGGVLAFDSR
jgi:predicted amidohydrolase YtcJ